MPGPGSAGRLCHSVAMADGSWEPAAERSQRLITQALDVVPNLQPPVDQMHCGAHKRELDAVLLRQAAQARGFDVTALCAQASLISTGASALVVHKNMPSTLSGLDRAVTNNKHLTKRVLAAAGLPVARGHLVADAEGARAVFGRMGGPVVTKPIVGSGGRGVTVDITTAAQLARACAQISERRRHIVIEEMVTGVDVRVMTVGARAVAAVLRVPPSVVGDGQRTITQLVTAKNHVRAANSYTRSSPIRITAATRGHLARQDLVPDAVPAAGRRVLLSLTANISGGGDNYEITDLVHPGLLHLAEQAAACFPRATHTGIDLIVERIDAGVAGQRAIISEVNLNNEIGMHILPMYGPPVGVHHLLIDELTRGGRHETGPTPAAPGRNRSASSHGGAASPNGGTNPEFPGPSHGGAGPEHSASDPSGPEPAAGGLPPVSTDQLRAWAVRCGGPAGPIDQAGGEVDAAHLRASLHAAGYTEVHLRGALVFASDGSQDVVFHRTGRSVISAELARTPQTLRALAAHLGIPTVPDIGSNGPGAGCEVLFLNCVPAASRVHLPPGPGADAAAGESRRRGLHTYLAAGCPSPELLHYARLLTGVIGPAPVLVLRFALRHQPSAGPFWALESIEPDPVLAGFAPPGQPGLHQRAARILLRSAHYTLPAATSAHIG